MSKQLCLSCGENYSHDEICPQCRENLPEDIIKEMIENSDWRKLFEELRAPLANAIQRDNDVPEVFDDNPDRPKSEKPRRVVP